MSHPRIPRILIGAATGATALMLAAIPAGAHTTVFPTEAADGGYAKFDFRVPHGCDGESTEVLRVQIPEGVMSVKPQVVAGWTIEVETEELDEPIEGEGDPVTERVSEVSWTGGPLPDGHLQEFGLSVKLPELGAGETLYFPAIQECGDTEAAWIEIPEDGADPDEELESPAPAVVLTAAGGHGDDAEADESSPVTEAAAATTDDGGTDGVAVAALVVAGLALAVGGAGIVMGRKQA